MTPKLLVVPQDSAAIRTLMPQLVLQSKVVIDSVPNYAAAIASCAESAPPNSVITHVNDHTPGLLELMIALDTVRPRVSLLTLVGADAEFSFPIKTSSSVLMRPAHRPATELITTIMNSMNGHAEEAPRRQGVDYLMPAVLGRRSIRLELTSKEGSRVVLEIVGGDLWNAYGAEHEALDALRTVLFSPIARAEVRSLQTIPGERQIDIPGLQALRSEIQQPPEEAPPQDPPPEETMLEETPRDSRPSAEVMPFPTPAPRAFLADPPKSGQPNAAASDPAAAGPEEMPIDQFERLVQVGIEASLARDFSSAAEAFEMALELRPGDRRAQFNLERVRQYLD